MKEREGSMEDSNGTPLLGRESSGQAVEGGLNIHSESTLCLFDRIGLPFYEIFRPRNLAIASGPVATICIFLVARYHGFGDDTTEGPNSSKQIGAMLGALVWMASWWIFEPVPIAITSLLPLVLFPFFEIMESEAVASEYMNDIVVLMLGTFILALAIDKYDLHKRLSLKILLLAGGEKMNPRLVLAGFISGPAFISMWMSNTSAAAMMIPMATGLLQNLKHEAYKPPVRTKSSSSMTTRDQLAEEGQASANDGTDIKPVEDVDAKQAIFEYSQGVILGVTYGVALGGMTTQIGCGPDLILPGIYSERFPGAPEVTFLLWMKFAMPLVILWLVPMWMFLCWSYCPPKNIPVIESSLNRTMVEKAYQALGPVSFAETFVFVEFCVIVVLWITRSFGQTPGWGSIFNNFPDDGTVAIAAAILLFVVPNRQKDGEMLMDWKTCKNISWSVILLLGGGFALSKGIQESGVSTWIGVNMEFFENVPYLLLTPVLTTILSLITEFSSNAATATLFLPIFAEVAVSINIHPLLLMIPATFASSFAFVLPSGTPPTAIAIGTGYLTVHSMGHPGLFMHVLGILLLSILIPTLGASTFGLDQSASSLPWL